MWMCQCVCETMCVIDVSVCLHCVAHVLILLVLNEIIIDQSDKALFSS